MRVSPLAFLAAVPLLLFAQSREKRVVPVNAAARQSSDRQPKVAVLAGVGNYPSRSGLSSLRYPAHDVELMQAELERQGYKVVALKDQEATRGSIEQALRDAAELVDRGRGTVLFFFSGHGFQDKGANYLASFEATSANLAGSGLAVTAVENLLKATGAPRQVMLIDACRNEPGKGGGARSFDRLEAAAGLRVLFSTKAEHISYEDDDLGSGRFTHFLCRGLRGEAAGADGLVTFRDLADYVTGAVSTYAFRKGQMQVPYEAGESSGDFLLASAASGGAAPVVPGTAKVNSKDAVEGVSTIRRPHKVAAGTTKVNPKDGLPYVWIPPGTFTMGCSPGDVECFAEEKPVHEVTITKGFWLGQTPVTQQAYQRVTGKNPSHFEGANLPVESVNWNESRAYCAAIGGRLPTEAEWEYAARAGSTGARYGNLNDIAWHNRNSGGKTHEVGQKQPNAFGLYDMLGNVWQWVANWYGNYPAGAQNDPSGSANGQSRVLRGGSWCDYPRGVRVSGRDWDVPAGDTSGFMRTIKVPSIGPARNYVGFRCIGE